MATPESPIPTTETAPEASNDASSVTHPEWDAMNAVLSTVYNHRLEEGYDPSKVFQRKVNKRTLPDYYDVIKEPMALSTIKAKVASKQYKNFTEYVRDFALIPHNAQVYNRPDAGAYQDAIVIRELLEKEFKKLADGGVISADVAKLPFLGEIPAQDDVDPVEEAEEEEDQDEADEDEDEEEEDTEDDGRRKKKRGRRSTAKPDKDDKDVADQDPRKKRGRPPRVDTPMEARIKAIMKGMRKPKSSVGGLMINHFERLPDKAAMPEYFQEIKQPIALDVIKKKLKRKKYQSIEQFMKDVDLMFDNAKSYNQDNSVIYKDAVALQKETRQVAEEEKKKPDTDYVMEDGRLPMPNGILHRGELWKVGDWVHIQNANDITKPIVAQIYRTWQDQEGSKWVNACWYYRPEQTVHRFDRHFFENEVMKTGQYRDHPIDDVTDRCFVMFFTRYNKGRPREVGPEKDVYVCEARYNEENHKLNKIKTWASCLPDEVRDKDYEMDLFDAPKKMKKVPSPIAYLLKDDAKETDDLPKPVWGAENAPPKIGAVHKRPRDPKDSPPPEPTPTPPPQPPPQPQRAPSNISIPNNESVAPSYPMSGTPTTHQPPLRTATPSHPPPRTSYTPSHPAQYHHSASPAPFQPTAAPAQQHGSFAPPPLTPHGSFQSQSGTTSGPTASFSHLTAGSYATPQTYQPRPVAPNYSQLQAAAPTQSYSGPTGAATSYAPTPTVTVASQSQRGYTAPQPPEVYCLAEAANQSIPEEVRRMFHCDEAGRVLFFTSPPTDTGAVMPLNLNEVVGKGLKSDDKKNGEKEREVLKLGHSVRYLGAKQKRDELVAAKRKREAEDEAAREGQRKKTKLAQAAEIQKRFDEVTARAIDALGEQLAVETKRAMLENAGGEKGIKEVRREVELLEARWRVEAEKERARTERQTMRDKREDKRVEILG